MLIKLPANELFFVIPAMVQMASPVVPVAPDASGLTSGFGGCRALSKRVQGNGHSSRLEAVIQLLTKNDGSH